MLLASTAGLAHRFRATGRRLIYCHPAASLLHTDDGSLPRTRTARVVDALGPSRRGGRRAGRDRFVAGSSSVRARLKSLYGIDAEVLPAPPPGTATTPPHAVAALQDWRDGFHLLISRLVAYRNVGEAVDAFRRLPDERLVVVGTGPLRPELAVGLPKNVRLLDELTDGELAWCYARADAVLAPFRDDYGHTALEAAAAGTPTLALRAGALVDTVRDGVTGCIFDVPTPEAIAAAVHRSRGVGWDRAVIHSHAEAFSEARFIDALHTDVAELTR